MEVVNAVEVAEESMTAEIRNANSLYHHRHSPPQESRNQMSIFSPYLATTVKGFVISSASQRNSTPQTAYLHQRTTTSKSLDLS
jgi:hypothetical protein